MLLRTLLAWLRGEPRVCSMVRIPSETEEDMRRPERERERLVSERIALENRIENLLCLHGIAGFKPRLKKAAERLDGLRSFAGGTLPPDAAGGTAPADDASSHAERAAQGDRSGTRAGGDGGGTGCAVQQIQMLARLVGLGLATATGLTREVFCRSFADRRAIAGFVGLTGTPVNSGGSEREQGISETAIRGCAVYCCAGMALVSLPAGQRAQLLVRRTHRGAKGRIRKIMVVALARKLLVALWRYARPAKCRPAPASPPPRGERSNHAPTQIEKPADDDRYLKPGNRLGGR